VLARHFPNVPNLGDLTEINGGDWSGKVDVLWGSPPCQAFSAAGRRGGISDPRGALTLRFADLADQISPAYVTLENVKGILSGRQNAFGQLVGALAGEECELQPPGKRWPNAGYVVGPTRRVAWRLFDAKHGGVPQQRRRIFLVACPRNGADPRDVLFEREAVYGDYPPSVQQAPSHPATPRSGAPVYFNCDSNPKFSTEYAYPLKADTGSGGRACILPANDNTPRRLTPLECERLMGFPDGWTAIPGARDSERWSALGNSLAIPDVRWIGERIKASIDGSLIRHHWPDIPVAANDNAEAPTTPVAANDDSTDRCERTSRDGL
jgi:DNA (cytosine-5)-methyltransferase 1